ncbi:T9SS sorting signal type C domain-containing protein [Flavobacterium johnsoniae]|uniref:T9SS sorting signal type C domain-containing protein n=1 Tax=Flavobacterium johnsoniae TaxID=986 RepID=UPI0025AFE604|nr:T9SS sorting signal type C domain-containing protein [Flavobacterium johnsoniae]WJS95575.1 T9SS sorting signal type C domain-containing protein [Flavobacterium johnsoniae]
MKRTLLIPNTFSSISISQTHAGVQLKLGPSLKLNFFLILILSLFYTSTKAQTITHTFPTGGNLNLPAGMDQVTLEGWGAGGAGGAAITGFLIGRSGGGGGGGAYAKGTINTSAVQSLTLVVGGVTAGGSGNGANGGASYATGFTGFFNAGGGTGGNANLSDTAVPSGGNGGIATGNITATNGQNGTAGGSSAAGLLLVSGGGGNAANLGTGAGGTGGLSLSSLAIAISVGNNGNPYGGGGGGAISSGAVQNGGSGAQGYLTATYTCKTYSLSTTNASNACTTGGTSTVNITGTPTSLPRGNYTVTYNRSSPSATGLTANFTVTTAGTGSFTAAGFSIVGNSTITITSLRSVDCTSTISVNNSVTISVTALPTITLGSIASVCSTAIVQNVNLPYSATTNVPTNYSITWSASPANSFVAVTNATLPASQISIAVPAGTAAGNYTGTLTVSNAGCVSTNYTITVPVIASPVAPTASAAQQPTCDVNTGTITVTSPASGTGFSYSLDGITFTNTTGVFAGLNPGTYNVRVRNNTTLCQSPTTPVIINPVVAKTWNGSLSANWGTSGNWTPAGVPLASDCVVIPQMTTSPIISGTDGVFFANRITIQNNGSLIVQSSNTLTVTNDVNVLGTGSLVFENNSSLVQISEAVNTGNITYKRNSKPIRRYDATYWSSPVTRVPAFTLQEFSPNTLLDKYYKYVPNTGWVVILNGTEEMVKGNGYNIRAPQPYDANTAAIYGGVFTGVPNNGTILGPNAVAQKSNLLGNPYPSAIYADRFIVDNAANYYGTLYFWTHNSLPVLNPADGKYYYNNNDFAFYNLSGNTTVGSMTGTGATTPGNTEAPLGYIAAGQGFIATSKTGQRAVFTNSMRVSSHNGQFFKSNQSEFERHRVWLNFSNTQGAFKQILIGYIEGATDLWDDNYDAATLDANPLLDFYSINGLIKLTIQGRAIPFEEADKVPLGYRSSIAGDFTIGIERTDGNLSKQNIYLEDKTTNTIHDLKAGAYSFTTAIGVFNERFVLRYTNKNLATNDFAGLDKNVLVSVKDKNIKLQAISDAENLKEMTIYDIGGKLLYQKENIDNKELLITNLPPTHQVLLVKVTLSNGYTVTKKIIF